MHSTSLLVLVLSCALFACAFAGTNYTWQSSGGSWSDSSNWLPVGVPGAGDTAMFMYSSCSGIDDDGNADCPVDLGSSLVTIAALIIQDTGANLALTGSLTVTTYSSLTGFSFYDLTLTTQGYTEIPAGQNTPEAVGTTWTLQGVTNAYYLNFALRTTRITNSGTLNVIDGTYYGFETADNYGNGQEGYIDYSLSSFTNAGTLNFNSPDDDEDDTTVWEVTFVNTGTFNLISGFLQFSSEQDPTTNHHLTTKWSGTVSSAVGTSIQFYNGVHNITTGTTWNVLGELRIFGGSGVWNRGQCGAVQFDLPITIANLYTDNCISIIFQQPTTINFMEFVGGTLTGASNSIVIKNMTGGSGVYTSIGAVPLFYGAITIIDGYGLAGVLSVIKGSTLQVNGTLGCYIHLDWYGAYQDSLGTYDDGGSIIVNPSGTLLLHASDDTTVYANYFYIPVVVYGKLVGATAQDVGATRSDTEIGVFINGGTLAGPVSTIAGLVDDQDEYTYGDLEFGGNWNIEQGATFAGPGHINFFSADGIDKTVFDIAYAFTQVVSFGYSLNAFFNHDLNFTTFYFNGGTMTSTTGAHLNLLAGSTHYIIGNSGEVLKINGITFNNYGNLISVGDSVMQGTGLVWNNYGNFTTNRFSFGYGDGDEVIFNNYGTYIQAAGSYCGENMKFYNNGTIINQVSSAANANNNLEWKGSDVYLLATGTYQVNIYAAAVDFGSSETPYDVASFATALSCRFGGTLHINFAGYTPTAGEVYTIFYMDPNGKVGNCVCQFDTITTSGLDSSLGVGIKYDTTDDTYTNYLFVTVTICSSGDSSCITNKRSGASCPSSVPSPTTGSATTGSGSDSGSGSATTSGAASVIVSFSLLALTVLSALL